MAPHPQTMGAVQLVTNVTAGLIILVSALKYLRSKRGPGTLPSSSPAAQAPAKVRLHSCSYDNKLQVCRQTQLAHAAHFISQQFDGE